MDADGAFCVTRLAVVRFSATSTQGEIRTQLSAAQVSAGFSFGNDLRWTKDRLWLAVYSAESAPNGPMLFSLGRDDTTLRAEPDAASAIGYVHLADPLGDRLFTIRGSELVVYHGDDGRVERVALGYAGQPNRFTQDAQYVYWYDFPVLMRHPKP